MHVLVTHSINDAKQFFANGPRLLEKPPTGLRAQLFLPTADARQAVCVWETSSVAALREYVDGVLGAAAKNEYTELDTQHAMGLPK